MKSMFALVSILTGVAIIAGLFGSFYPAEKAQAQILTSPRALLGPAEIDDLLEVGDLDDVLGVTLLPIRTVLDDEAALRDVLIARITRLLVLRATLHGDLTVTGLDEIIDFVLRLELADTFRLLMIHRVLQLQVARFAFLDDVGLGFDDVLLFRGFGVPQLLVFREFDLEDLIEEFRDDLRVFRFGFAEDDDFNAGLHFRLNGAFAKRDIVVDDIDGRILPEKRIVLARSVGERDERLVGRPRIFGPEREEVAFQRELGFRQRLQNLDAERQAAPRAPIERPAFPRVAPRAPADDQPAPRVAPRAPVERPAPPRVAPRIAPADDQPAPEVAPRAPVERPAPPRVAPRIAPGQATAPRIAPSAPAERPAAPRAAPRPATPRVAPRAPVQRPR